MSLRDAWESQAANWTTWARTPLHDHYYWRFNLPRFLDLVPPPGRLTVDLGCGEGRLGRLLQEQGHEVVGFDGSPTLARAAATHQDAHAVAVADMAELPVRDRVADLTIAFMSLQDVDQLSSALQEAGRILARDGRLCLAIVHPFASAGDWIDDDEESKFVIRDSYLEPRRLVEPIEREGLPMTFNSEHRPLSAYFRGLEQAGFLVEILREPVPDPDHIMDRPPIGRGRRLPWFLHLRAVRR